VRMVVNELRGEKIDIVPFSEDFPDFIAKALSPAKVTHVIVSEDGTQADVIVPDHQLSLAIGKEGQNARLAARLTGVRIDIRGESQPIQEVEAPYDEADYAEGEWVENAETGKMEWHSADGTVVSADEWERGGAESEPTADASAPVADAEAAAPTESVAETETRESVSEAAGSGGDSATE